MRFGDSVSYGARPWRAVGEVLPAMLRRKRFLHKGRYGPLREAWRQVVGEELAAHTRIAAFRHGRVAVTVDSAALLQELRGFLHETILEALRRTPGGEDVAALRFELGADPEP